MGKHKNTQNARSHTALQLCIFKYLQIWSDFRSRRPVTYTWTHNLSPTYKTTNERYEVARQGGSSVCFFSFLNLPKKKKKPVHLRHSPSDTKPLMSVKRAIISKIKTFVYHGSHILNSVWEAGGKTDSDVNSELAKGLCVTDIPLLDFTRH